MSGKAISSLSWINREECLLLHLMADTLELIGPWQEIYILVSVALFTWRASMWHLEIIRTGQANQLPECWVSRGYVQDGVCSICIGLSAVNPLLWYAAGKSSTACKESTKHHPSWKWTFLAYCTFLLALHLSLHPLGSSSCKEMLNMPYHSHCACSLSRSDAGKQASELPTVEISLVKTSLT